MGLIILLIMVTIAWFVLHSSDIQKRADEIYEENDRRNAMMKKNAQVDHASKHTSSSAAINMKPEACPQVEQCAQANNQHKVEEKIEQDGGIETMPNNRLIEVQNEFFDENLIAALLDGKMEDFLLMDEPYNGIMVSDEEGKQVKFFPAMLKTLYRFSNNDSNIQVNRIFEKAIENIIRDKLNNPEVVLEILEILYYQWFYEAKKESPYCIDSAKILELLKRELIKHKNDYEKFMKKVNDHGLEKEVNMWQIIGGEYKEISETTGKESPELIGEKKTLLKSNSYHKIQKRGNRSVVPLIGTLVPKIRRPELSLSGGYRFI